MISTKGASPVRSVTARAAARSPAPASRRSPGTEARAEAAGADIGFASWSARIRSRICSDVASSSGGRNRCSGDRAAGSSPGSPPSLKMPSKSPCCSGQPVESGRRSSLSRREDHLADHREPFVGHEPVGAAEADPLGAEPACLHRILGRVRVRPYARRRNSSAQPRIVLKFSSIAGGEGTGPMITSPAPPSIVMPCRRRALARRSSPYPPRSPSSPSDPATQGFPIPRATKRVRVMPPRAVDAAWWIRPRMSSWVVSQRMGSLLPPPCCVFCGAGIEHDCSPGGRPERHPARGRELDFGARVDHGAQQRSSCPGSMRATASSRETSPSTTIPTATLSAAAAVRVPCASAGGKAVPLRP